MIRILYVTFVIKDSKQLPSSQITNDFILENGHTIVIFVGRDLQGMMD
jgi:hypothetical protein